MRNLNPVPFKTIQNSFYALLVVSLLLAMVAGCGTAPLRHPTAVACTADDRQDLTDIRKAAASSSVIVIVNKVLPSGTARRDGGVGVSIGGDRILVPAHVVRFAKSVTATEAYADPFGYLDAAVGAQPVAMTVLAMNEDADVAIIAPADGGLSVDAADVNGSAMDYGDPAFAVTPRSGTVRGSVRSPNATVAPLTTTFIQTDLASRRGDSGSPLMNQCGQVTGILTLGNNGDDSYFVPVAEAYKALGM